MKTVLEFAAAKKEKRPISMVTAYDYWTAKILDQTPVDCLLVGDSAAMVMHGYPSTIHATLEMMCTHTAAVARGAKSKWIVADMPFLTFRRGPSVAIESAGALMQAGAHAVKLEGVLGHEQAVQEIVQSGIPVMGHLGLTPQSIHLLGGFRVQGKDLEAARSLREQALALQSAGCFALVLECVPAALAKEISIELDIPTIGIGAGAATDGQVLVLQDLLGADSSFSPKFLRRFAHSESVVRDALSQYHHEVIERTFPTEKESY